jgi:hypothetical protein
MFFRTQWRRWLLRHSPADLSPTRARILVVVEGPHDIEFLSRISTILSLQASAVPNLAQMERRQQLVFIPFGGGDLSLWTTRLEALHLPEWHPQQFQHLHAHVAFGLRFADPISLHPLACGASDALDLEPHDFVHVQLPVSLIEALIFDEPIHLPLDNLAKLGAGHPKPE